MQDAGLTKGIIVSVGGLRTGARVAADQAHVEIWGPDEIRHLLGEEALAGLPLRVPDRALGVAVTASPEAAEREIRKARSGFAGIGSEDVTSVDLLWVPAVELHLAVTRLRPGLISDKEEVVRRWLLFETLTGSLIGAREEARTFEDVALEGGVLRQQRSPAQIVSDVRRKLGKHRSAKSEAAVKSRQAAYNAVGLPGSARELAVEAEKTVFVPFYVGTLRRKGSERLVAIHAGTGARVEAVERALHEKVNVVRQAIDDVPKAVAAALVEPDSAPAVGSDPAPAVEPVLASDQPTQQPCRCGAPMVLRRRKADGEPFFGCSTFPRCRHTAPVTA